jgi:hypothetical protein
VALTNAVVRGEPFQFTTESLVKFVPVTVSVNPVALQYGVEFCEVVDAETFVMAGAGPAVGLILNKTMFDTSVVVVEFPLFGFVVPETAEPGMSIATWTVPAVVSSDAGTGAVNWVALTNVVTSGVPFHRMIAPET